MRSKLTGYDVGALLYCPANAHGSIVGALVEQRFPTPYSLAFCLEDTVREDAVADAERMLRGTLSRIASAAEGGSFFLPPIFVRVRSPEQLLRLAEEYAPFSSILRGFILPKFFLENCGAYLALLDRMPGDWDVTTSARPEETMALFAGRAVPTGLRHGTVTVKTEQGGVEITTLRRDGAYRDHRRPETVTFTDSLEEDLRRRDFTTSAYISSVFTSRVPPSPRP